MSPDDAMIFSLITLALLGGFGIAGAWMLAEARKERRRHDERMRALELGRPVPGEGGKPPASMSARLGVWVPIGVFGAAALATGIDSDVGPFAVVSAGAVGMTSVICATVLAVLRPAGDGSADGHGRLDPSRDAKPAVDEDAFDVVGRRG